MELKLKPTEEKELLRDFIISYYSIHNTIMIKLNLLQLNLDFITIDAAKKILNDILDEEENLNI